MEADEKTIRELMLRMSVATPLTTAAAATGSAVAAGVSAGVALGADHLIAKGQERRRQRAATALDLAAQLRGIDSSDFAIHIASDDHILELAMMLLEAASRAADEQHFMMLAQLLAEGGFAEDEATLDEYAYVARAVAGLGVGHLQTLRTLNANRDPRREGLARYDEVTRDVPQVLKGPVRLDLVNRNLIAGYSPNEIAANVKAELVISYDTPVPSAYALTEFGREVCRRLDEAAAVLREEADDGDGLASS